MKTFLSIIVCLLVLVLLAISVAGLVRRVRDYIASRRVSKKEKEETEVDDSNSHGNH